MLMRFIKSGDETLVKTWKHIKGSTIHIEEDWSQFT